MDTVELVQQMIRNRCVNDGSVESGEEDRNARLIADYLSGSGVDVQRYETAPGRSNLVARIEGHAGGPAVLLLGHTDVVPVNAERWERDPFGGELVNDFVWGRGAIDMFNLTASMAVAVRRLASEGYKPRGTLIYAAVADEEAGGVYGAQHLATHERDAVQADYVITESGGFPMPSPAGIRLPVIVAEKGIHWCTLRIAGTPGHGSMPFRTDNALVKAAEVVRRLAAFQPQTRIEDTWRGFVGALGLPEEMSAPLLDPDALVDAAQAMPIGLGRLAYSCTHTTIAPTVINAGGKLNIIPDSVDVDLDIRTLPGDGPDEIRAMLDEALGDLADAVEVIPRTVHAATVSSADTPMWDAMSRVAKRFYEGSELVPMLMPGATDARFFRTLGATAYGFGLFSQRMSLDDLATMGHGDNERVDVQSLEMVTEMWDVLLRDVLG
jgi:acetylornithine deacetylase/succinyl-diaminopimelate desuccinylase-like protein